MHNKYKKFILKAIAAITLMVIFLLVVIPVGIISIYPKQMIGKEDTKINKVPEAKYIKVYRHLSGETEKIEFEEYVKGVVAGEMPSTFEMEALKAQAVAARTYALSKIMRSGDSGNPAQHPSAPICDDTHCQVYRDLKELKKLKSEEWMKTGWPRIEKAVESTRGEVMYYQGNLVEQPLFHSSSGGRTENSEDVFVSAVPYLRSVDSPYESEASHKSDVTSFTLSDFKNKIQKAYSDKSFGTVNKNTIAIISRSEGGRVTDIQIGNVTLTGRNIRDTLGLTSANFNISYDSNNIVFTTTGYGHGVGMSQWGANGMAKSGYDYKEILTHYYSGVDIK
ncbi:stage II sporulation protein D [Anaerovorax odorimutans]|uniref:stage II sporulation protein D n=1 Tax=Anaerovorax odorimutans TaxID=109327 RepID=UPI0003FE89C1|nr:stage II sporulation protein D [Anaerovorax odorimutans]